MRDYLAKQAGVNPKREFYLLAALGKDLPGAIKIRRGTPFNWKSEFQGKQQANESKDSPILRFSLAGVQLKFSAILESQGGLTIPADGIGGSWIVKLPSAIYANVPENEFTMMEIAKKMGMDVPETKLIEMEHIMGIPRGVGTVSTCAFSIKRFDRDASGNGIHIEDLAQVFGVYPEKKYESVSYQNIAQLIWRETGENGLAEFIRRFIFNALIGNGDMHLKNWSLIYQDKKQASLAPAYDFVSTVPYIPNDQLALTFVDSKRFDSLSYAQFKRFAAKAKLPEELVLEVVQQTVKDFAVVWKSVGSYSLNKIIIQAIDEHLKLIPIWKA